MFTAAIVRAFPAAVVSSQMTQASIDVVGIGNAVDGETVTPMLPARRITINPELDKPGTGHPRAGVLVLDVGVGRSSQRRC
jgi:hypothetical protein